MVGSLPLPHTYLLPKTIIDITGDYTDLSVGIVDGPYPSLLHLLRHGEMDIIVGALRDPLPTKDVGQEVLFSEPLSIIVRTDHPLTKGSGVRLADACASTG